MAKYLATVMDRHYIGEDAFIFTTSHVVLGDYDETNKIFIDKNGNEYAPMLEPDTLRSEIPYAYANLMKLQDLKENFDDMSLTECISYYEFNAKAVVYLVGFVKDNTPFCVPIPLERIKQDTQNAYEKIKSGEEGKQNHDDEYEDKDENENGLNASERFTGEANPNIMSLITDVINGEFSLEALKTMLKNIKIEQEDIDSLVDTIELQIEATEKGESYVKLKEEKQQDDNKKQEKVKTQQEDDKKRQEELKKQSKLSDEEKIRKIDIVDLLKKVTKTLIAQDEPTRRVITEIARKEQSKEAKSRGILVTGSTGVGKTKMMKLIAKYLDRPFYKIDATKLTIPGYVGTDIEEELWKLFVECGGDLNKAEHAIVFIDEIDKKGSDRKDDVSGKGVLNVLLPFIEGTEYDAVDSMKSPTKKVKINTGDMIVILGGAYTDVYKNLIEKNAVGFGSDVNKNKTPRAATPSDFVTKAQMTDEFMGRVAIIKLNDLSVEDLVRVINESDESSLAIQKKLFEELGVKLTAGDDFIRKIAQNAYDRKTGARGLNTVVEEATWEAYYDAYVNSGQYDEVILTEETVENPKQYKLVKKSNKEGN